MKELLNKIIYRSQELNLIMNLPQELELLDYMFVGTVDNKIGDHIYEFVMIFETRLDDIEKVLEKALPHVNADTVFWLAYPSRDGAVRGNVNPKRLHEIALALGYEQYTNISINKNYDAMRFLIKK